MPAPIGSGKFEFADGNTGHSCDLGSAPLTGQWDVLCANSDTVVSTPSGFTLVETVLANQGSYVFARKAVGGEGSTVTVTTSGNFNAQVSWSRWGGLDTVDTSTSTPASGAGNATPAHSTGPLAETGEVVVAFGALHGISTGNQNTPVWSAGYTAITEAKQGTSGAGVVGYVGYKLNAGTAAEAPQVSWSGDSAFDRYMLAITFRLAVPDPPGQGLPVTSATRSVQVASATDSAQIVSATGGAL